MKKLFYTVLVIGTLAASLSAEGLTHAIGLRIGGGTYSAAADLSYQESTSRNTRMQLELGFMGGFGLTAVYKWNWELIDNLSVFAGPGGQFKFVGGANAGWGIGGQTGIEYDLNAMGWPFLVGVDTRPMWGDITIQVNGAEARSVGFTFDFAVTARYMF